MARPRKIRTRYHIPYVHVAHGRVTYRPWIPPDQRDGLTIGTGGFLSPPVLLGKDGDDPDTIYSAYVAARTALKSQHTAARNTIGWIVDQYMASRQFRDLSPESQRRAYQLSRITEHTLKINGIASTLAHLHIHNLSQPLMHQIADKRLDNYQNAGRKGVVQVNREVTFLSTALSWACNYITDLGVTTNPLRGFKKLKEQGSDRYVTEAEYRLQYDAAFSIRAWLPPLLELTYLTATRGIETLDIRLSDCTEEGIRIYRRKGSRDNLIRWSERLRAAYESALALHDKSAQKTTDPHLLCQRNGEALARATAHAAMQQLKQALAASHPDHKFWNLHALKARGVSDSKDKTIAGHVTEAMRNRYDRSLPAHDPVR